MVGVGDRVAEGEVVVSARDSGTGADVKSNGDGVTRPVSIRTPAKSVLILVVAVSRNSSSVQPTKNAAPSGLTATHSNSLLPSVPAWRMEW